jgi:hypothetical protein
MVEVTKDKDPNYPLSVYLTREEKKQLQDIVEKEGLQSTHELAQYAIRKLVAEYQAGKDVLNTGKRLIDPLKGE